MAKQSNPKRDRILVNVGRAPAPLAEALAQTSQWHRGRRLIQLATLGLAAEQSGLRVDDSAGSELQLYAGISRIAGLLGDTSPVFHVSQEPQQAPNPAPTETLVVPDDFLDQFV